MSRLRETDLLTLVRTTLSLDTQPRPPVCESFPPGVAGGRRVRGRPVSQEDSHKNHPSRAPTLLGVRRGPRRQSGVDTSGLLAPILLPRNESSVSGSGNASRPRGGDTGTCDRTVRVRDVLRPQNSLSEPGTRLQHCT